MNVSDLLSDPMLRLRLATPSDPSELSVRIESSVATESIDPSGYLSPRTLVITTGMALNFTDERIWTGYVERLIARQVPALAFGTGKAHPQIPAGLLIAARNLRLPILVVPDDVPFLRLQQHVAQVLAEERFALARRSWALADECTRMAAHGADFLTLLQHLATRLCANLAVVDDARAPFLSVENPREAATSARRARFNHLARRVEIPLPVGGSETWFLTAHSSDEDDLLTLLTPSVAALGMSISSRTILSKEDAASTLALSRALRRTDADAGTATARALHSAGIDPDEGVRAIMVSARSHMRRQLIAWRLRQALASSVPAVTVELADRVLLVAPSADAHVWDPVPGMSSYINAAAGDALVVTAQLHDAEDLVFTVQRLAHSEHPGPGAHTSDRLNLDALISFLVPVARHAFPRTFLRPLLEHRDSRLLAFLQEDLVRESLGATAAHLGIHRNTARARRRTVEALLGVNLERPADRTLCAIALAAHQAGDGHPEAMKASASQ